VTTNGDEKADTRSNNNNVKFLLGHTDNTAMAAVLCPLQVTWRPLSHSPDNNSGRLQDRSDINKKSKRA